MEFYTGVSTVSEASANANNNATLWIQTKYLATSKASTPSLVQKTVTHAAQGYTAAGTKTKKVFSAFSTVYVKANPIHIAMLMEPTLITISVSPTSMALSVH